MNKARLYGAMSVAGQEILEAAGALRHARYPDSVIESAEEAARSLLRDIERHRAADPETDHIARQAACLGQ